MAVGKKLRIWGSMESKFINPNDLGEEMRVTIWHIFNLSKKLFEEFCHFIILINVCPLLTSLSELCLSTILGTIHITWTLDIASFFTLIEFKSLSQSFGCGFVQWTWWELRNWTFGVKVSSIWWFKFEFSVVDILLTSLASGADDWPSCAIASKQTTNVKKRWSNF